MAASAWNSRKPNLNSVHKLLHAREVRGTHPSLLSKTSRRSPALLRRFALQSILHGHDGCVNTATYNAEGSKIASGSDDQYVIVWDAHQQEEIFRYHSGHQANIFQSRFMPNCNDSIIITCSLDGQVIIGKCTEANVTVSFQYKHRTSAHKISIRNSETFLSVGEDSNIVLHDLRIKDSTLLGFCTQLESRNPLPLNSVDWNPWREHEFLIGGDDGCVRLFDIRAMSQGAGEAVLPLLGMTPESLAAAAVHHCTCAVYTKDGSQIVANNSDGAYLFDPTKRERVLSVRGFDVVVGHSSCYRDHLNEMTVKEINTYGPNSEFIVSGSDCGKIFFYEKNSGRLVHKMTGDADVVNVVQPHPTLPMLLTAGIDPTVKIWSPVQKNLEKLSVGSDYSVFSALNFFRRMAAGSALEWSSEDDEFDSDDEDGEFDGDEGESEAELEVSHQEEVDDDGFDEDDFDEMDLTSGAEAAQIEAEPAAAPATNASNETDPISFEPASAVFPDLVETGVKRSGEEASGSRKKRSASSSPDVEIEDNPEAKNPGE